MKEKMKLGDPLYPNLVGNMAQDYDNTVLKYVTLNTQTRTVISKKSVPIIGDRYLNHMESTE